MLEKQPLERLQRESSCSRTFIGYANVDRWNVHCQPPAPPAPSAPPEPAKRDEADCQMCDHFLDGGILDHVADHIREM